MADLNPCSGCVSQAAFTKLLISDSPTDFSDAHRLRFLSENIQQHSGKRPSPAIVGFLHNVESLFGTGTQFIYGTLVTELIPGDFNVLLPWLLGPEGDTGTGTGTASGMNYFTPASCPSVKHLYIWRDHDMTFRITSCYVMQWQLEGRALQFREEGQGDLLRLSMFIVGSSRILEDQAGSPTVAWPNPEPELGSGDAYLPYYFKDGSLTLRGTSMGNYCERFRLTVDHRMEPRYRMSSSLSGVCSMGRNVILDTKMDWRDQTNILLDPASNAAATLAFTGASGNISTEFHFHNAMDMVDDPASMGKYSNVDWNVRHMMTADDTTADEWDIAVVNETA